MDRSAIDTVSLYETVEKLKKKYVNLWNSQEGQFPELQQKYSYIRQIHNERNITKFLKEVTGRINCLSEKDNIYYSYNEIIKSTRELLSKFIKIDNKSLEIIFSKEYQRASSNFINKAIEFDRNIKEEYILQAIRNLWIMNSIQVFLTKDIKTTESIFAYSMIYPYTDNYLDSLEHSVTQKKEFNLRLKLMLQGEYVKPINVQEEKVHKLIKLIEREYPRNEYPEVYVSLLAIHDAQEKSLFQQWDKIHFSKRDILEISFEKGGTSVVADGYLVNGLLTEEEIDFLFGYGAFLQLVDDLQDVNEDLDKKHTTIFTKTLEKEYLDNVTNCLFSFIKNILDSTCIFSTDESYAFKILIEESCYNLVLAAIAQNEKRYSKQYIKKIKKYSPLRFPFIKGLYTKINTVYNNLDKGKLVSLLDFANRL